MQQNKRVKCYCNAYKDLWEQLCILFDRPNNAQDDVIDADRFDLNVPERQEDWVVLPPPPVIEAPADAPTNEAAPDAPANEVVPVDLVHEVGPSDQQLLDFLHQCCSSLTVLTLLPQYGELWKNTMLATAL
ncbi:hypothetical protein Salat_2127900 [Sesamum alatum]|uniref:Uncharacterized protein n=1 Tax=Sesamum alatum TaxID=300844 RepID=A0AAE2CGX5_9LAMI|nr:hypothetical protein Salat_2127900 [Sesamum alatum]